MPPRKEEIEIVQEDQHKAELPKTQPLDYHIPEGFESLEEVRNERTQQMKEMAESPVLVDWTPDEDDERKWNQWCSKYIIIKSKNWYKAQTVAFNPESVELMKEGLDPKAEADKSLVTSTTRHYKLAWRRLMMILTKRSNKER